MEKEEIKIITLGDIFRNLETEEQAFEFLKYIKNLQQENQKYKEVIDKAIELLNHSWSFESGNKQVDEITKTKKWEIINLLKEVE